MRRKPGGGTPVPESLVYIHGLNSSPASHKARVLREHLAGVGLADRLLVPALSYLPDEAIDTLEEILDSCPGPAALVGSSLGGYYAAYLAERRALQAVLINPALRPYELLLPYLGPQRNLYTGERYRLTATHLAQLQALDVPQLTHPERVLLLIQTGDATLDFRQALAHFPTSPRILMAGGSHGFERFEAVVDRVLQFCGLDPAAEPGGGSAVP